MDRPEGKPHPRFFRLFMAALTATLIGVMMLSVIQFAPARALTGSFCSSGVNQELTSAVTITTTSTLLGTLKTGVCGVTGNLMVVGVMIPVNNATSGQRITGLSITDNASDTFTEINVGIAEVQTCNSASAGICPANQNHQLDTPTFATNFKGNSGHLALTLHYDAAPYTQSIGVAWMYFVGGVATPISGACGAQFGAASDVSLIYGGGYNDKCTVSVPAGGIAVEFGGYAFTVTSTIPHSGTAPVVGTLTTNAVSVGAAWCNSSGTGGGFCQFYMDMYINNSTSPFSLTTGFTCTACTSGSNGNWFGQATVVISVTGGSTTTTTINTNCLGGCSGGQNGTSIYLPPPTSTFFNLHFYASVNLQTPSQVDNVTFKVAAVHITTVTGLIYVCVWAANGVPSGGNPYVLVQSCNGYVLTNGTSNFFVHSNPQANLGANQSYAVGIMTTTTASRGSGASGSGISVYETSQVGITEYKYSVGSSTPPLTFFSNTQQTPHDWIYIHTIFPVVIITSTLSTVTTTISGTVIATSTSTFTATTLDMNLAVQNGTDYAIILLVLLFPAMALMVPIAIYTKSAPGAAIGFVAGLMIGSAIAAQALLVPPVFLGIMVIVGIFMIVGLMYGSRGST